MSEDTKCSCYGSSTTLGLLGYLGGAIYTAHQPGYNFWDGLVWFYYLGRHLAAWALS